MSFNNSYGIQAVDEETFKDMQDAVPTCLHLIHRCVRHSLPPSLSLLLFPSSHPPGSQGGLCALGDLLSEAPSLLYTHPYLLPSLRPSQLPGGWRQGFRLLGGPGVLQRRHRVQIRRDWCAGEGAREGRREGSTSLRKEILKKFRFSLNYTLPPSLPPSPGLNVYDIRIPCEVPGLCYDFSHVETFLQDPEVRREGGREGKFLGEEDSRR